MKSTKWVFRQFRQLHHQLCNMTINIYCTNFHWRSMFNLHYHLILDIFWQCFRQHPNTRDRAAVFLPSKIQPLGWPSSHTQDHLRSLTWSAVFFKGDSLLLKHAYIIYEYYHPGGDEPASWVLGRSSPWLVIKWLNNNHGFFVFVPFKDRVFMGPLPSMA